MLTRHAIGIAAAMALLGQQGGASAQSQDTKSANYIMPGCRDVTSNANRNFYLQGACTGIVRAISYFGHSNFGACIPERVSVDQATRVVIAYIDQRPARMHERFEELALEALQQAWPCRR